MSANTPMRPPGPSSQLPATEPELFETARAAVQAIKGRGRRSDGTAAPGNTLALRTGLHSRQLLQRPEIASWHDEQAKAIATDLGGEEEISTLARGHVREVARLEVILGALGDDLLAHGVLTGKGKTRAATMTYLTTLDRYVRLSAALGLERRQKRVPTLDTLLGKESA